MENFVAIPCITVIVYLFGELFKAFTKNTINHIVPALCGTLGGILGLVSFFVCPEFIAGEGIFSAIATGIVSGFSATGVNQVFKQTTKAQG